MAESREKSGPGSGERQGTEGRQESAGGQKTEDRQEPAEILFAPMEGITGFVFRNAFHQLFGGVTRFYTPFISPSREEPRITGPSKRDILPENNAGTPVVPQLLTNRAEDFLAAAGKLSELGYREINLNLGCPSGTVTAKNKGAGFLSETRELERFLREVTEHFPEGCSFTVKTRIGRYSPEEFPELLRIFNAFPIRLLIIHPRIRGEFYRGEVHMDVFAEAVRDAVMPLAYNGDIDTVSDIRRIRREFPGVHRIMIGRGLLKNPFLAEEYRYRTSENPAEFPDPFGEDYRREKLIAFHARLLDGYLQTFQTENAVICRMKELWDYLGENFSGCEREIKAIRKARTLSQYRDASIILLRNGNLRINGV